MLDAPRWNLATLALLETTPDAVVVVDDTGTILYANRLIEQVFGYPPDSLIGQSVELLVPEHGRGEHRQHRDGYSAATMSPTRHRPYCGNSSSGMSARWTGNGSTPRTTMPRSRDRRGRCSGVPRQPHRNVGCRAQRSKRRVAMERQIMLHRPWTCQWGKFGHVVWPVRETTPTVFWSCLHPALPDGPQRLGSGPAPRAPDGPPLRG